MFDHSTGDPAHGPVDLFTAGEAMALLLAEDQMPLAQATTFRRAVAGAESNVATGVARLGHTVRLAGRIGADPAGQWVKTALRAEDIDTSWLRVDDHRPTGILLRDCVAGQPISVSYYRHASAGSGLGLADVEPEAFLHAGCVFLSGITAMLSAEAAAYTKRVCETAIDAGIPVLFDPNVRHKLGSAQAWRDTLADLLPSVNTLLIGEDELPLLASCHEPSTLLSEPTTTVVVKRGSSGASAYTRDGEVHTPARTVPMVDPVGAGDAFNAGWISATLRGLAPEAALREAAVVASFVVAVPTDTAGLPSARERDRALEKGQHDIDR